MPAIVVEGPELLVPVSLEEIGSRCSSSTGKYFQHPRQQPLTADDCGRNPKDVLSEGLGTLKGTKAKIYVDLEAILKFMKAPPVPYALK